MVSAVAVWVGWLVLFLVCELVAAKQKQHGTFSETVWDWFGVRRKVILGPARRAILFLFLASLTAHLVWGTTVAPVIVFGALVGAIILFSIVFDSRIAIGLALYALFASASACKIPHINWPTQPPTTTTTTTLSPQPTPEPTPTPVSGCDLDGRYDPERLVGVEPKPALPSKLAQDINEVESELSGCNIGTDCIVGEYDIWVPKVAAALRARGWCVGIHIHPDALAISDPSDLSLNYAVHVHATGRNTVRWYPGAYVDAWRLPETPAQPTPTPTPNVEPSPQSPTNGLYGPPDPLAPEWSSLRQTWMWVIKPHGRVYDGTFKIDPKNFEKAIKDLAYQYCTAAGFVGRGECPLRPDVPEKDAVEAAVIGKPQWQGEAVQQDNPFQAICDGRCRICTQDGSVCSEWVN